MYQSGWDILPSYIEYLRFDKQASTTRVRMLLQVLNYKVAPFYPLPLTLENAHEIITRLKKDGRKPAYINHIITSLNSLITFLLEKNLGQSDIREKLNKLRAKDDRIPDANDVLSVEEVKLILNHKFKEPHKEALKLNNLDSLRKSHESYRIMFNLTYRLAARSGEVLKLRKKDIAFHNDSLTFYETKNGSDRTVCIPPDMKEELERYVAPLSDSDFLFKGITHKKNSPMSQEMVNRMFKKWASEVGIKRRMHAHILRHSAITHLLISGCPISLCQTLAGHRRLSTTQLYTHIVVTDLKDALLKYNPIIRQGLTAKEVIKRIKELLKDLRLEENKEIKRNVSEDEEKFTLEIKY